MRFNSTKLKHLRSLKCLTSYKNIVPSRCFSNTLFKCRLFILNWGISSHNALFYFFPPSPPCFSSLFLFRGTTWSCWCLRWRWSCWNKKSHFNNEVNLHMCQLFIYIYIDVWKSSQRMNLRDIGSETRLTILCKQTKMINKRLKCSTTSKKMLKYNKNNYQV